MTTRSVKRMAVNRASFDRAVSACKAIAHYAPHGFARFDVRPPDENGYGGDIVVRLGSPVGSQDGIEVRGDIAYGEKWRVRSSGSSWSADEPQQLHTVATTLGMAAALMAAIGDVEMDPVE